MPRPYLPYGVGVAVGGWPRWRPNPRRGPGPSSPGPEVMRWRMASSCAWVIVPAFTAGSRTFLAASCAALRTTESLTPFECSRSARVLPDFSWVWRSETDIPRAPATAFTSAVRRLPMSAAFPKRAPWGTLRKGPGAWPELMRCLILSAWAWVSWPSLTIWSIVCSSACFRSLEVWLWLRWRMPASFCTKIWPGSAPLGEGEGDGAAAMAATPTARAATTATGTATRSRFLFLNILFAVLRLRPRKVSAACQVFAIAITQPSPPVAVEQLVEGRRAEVERSHRNPLVRAVDGVEHVVRRQAQRKVPVADDAQLREVPLIGPADHEEGHRQ